MLFVLENMVTIRLQNSNGEGEVCEIVEAVFDPPMCESTSQPAPLMDPQEPPGALPEHLRASDNVSFFSVLLSSSHCSIHPEHSLNIPELENATNYQQYNMLLSVFLFSCILRVLGGFGVLPGCSPTTFRIHYRHPKATQGCLQVSEQVRFIP